MWVAVRAGDLYSPVTPESVIFWFIVNYHYMSNRRREVKCDGKYEREVEETYIANSILSNIDAILE